MNKMSPKSTRFSYSVLASIAVLALVLSTDTCQSASVSEYVSGAKNYLVSLVRDGILNKSTVVTSFSETMGTIRERFEAKKKSGELDGKDEAEVSSAYYKIVLEEIKNLRHKFEVDAAGEEETSAADKFMESSANFAKAVRKPKMPVQYDMFDMEMDMDEDDDDDELNGEGGLKNQLDSLDDLERLEMMDMDMGWGLSAENKAALHAKTLKVLADLVQNELKTIVILLVTSYMGGPALGALAVQAATAGIKMKLMQFFVMSVMDLFAAVLGQKIQPGMEITTGEDLATAPAAA